MRIEFRILGPLEVSSDGRVLPRGSPTFLRNTGWGDGTRRSGEQTNSSRSARQDLPT